MTGCLKCELVISQNEAIQEDNKILKAETERLKSVIKHREDSIIAANKITSRLANQINDLIYERRELKERIVELFDVIGQPKGGYSGEENDG